MCLNWDVLQHILSSILLRIIILSEGSRHKGHPILSKPSFCMLFFFIWILQLFRLICSWRLEGGGAPVLHVVLNLEGEGRVTNEFVLTSPARGGVALLVTFLAYHFDGKRRNHFDSIVGHVHNR